MDLLTLANRVASQNQKKAASQLLPQQQKTRSYGNDLEYSDLMMTMERFRFGETRGKWVLQYKINFPLGSDGSKRVVQKQIENYAQDYLESNTDKNDLKYIDVTQASLQRVEYTFNHEKWFKDNFSSRPKLKPPISLYWKYYKPFPRIIYVNNYGSDLRKFVQEKFEEWIDTKKSYLKHRNFRFIEKIAAKLFNFKWDYTSQRMYAHLKYSVILGSLALYMSVHHDKDASKSDIKKIQRQAANFGDVKRLDRYIKKLK